MGGNLEWSPKEGIAGSSVNTLKPALKGQEQVALLSSELTWTAQQVPDPGLCSETLFYPPLPQERAES